MGTKKLLREMLARRYRFTVAPDGGGWTIYFPDLPGCMSYAESWGEIGPMARKSFEIWMESEVERGHPIPDPVEEDGADIWPQGLAVAPVGPDGTKELTAEEVAARLGVNRSRVHQLARKLDLGRKVGNAKLFGEADVAVLERRPMEVGRPPDPIGAENRRWFADRHPGAYLDGGLAYTDPFTTGKQAEPTGRYLITAFWDDADGQRHTLSLGGATAREAVEALSEEIDRQAQVAVT